MSSKSEASRGLASQLQVGWPAADAERYRREGYWQGRTFGELLADWGRRWPLRTAVVDGERRFTYAELDLCADRLAAGLSRLGVRRGDAVLLQLPNQAEFVFVWFALVRLGAVPVHAMPGHRRSEITHLVTLTGAVAYLIPDRHARFDYRELAAEVREECPALRRVVVAGDPGRGDFHSLAELMEPGAPSLTGRAPAASDVALLLLSGGTTGAPKLIPRTHDDYAYNARASAAVCRLHGGSVYLAVLPIAFNFTMSCPGLLGTLGVGGTVVLARDPSPEAAFELIEREQVTITALNPPLTPLWLEEAGLTEWDLSSLELVQVGSARLDDTTASKVGPVLRCRLQQVFGMAEGLISFTRLDDSEELICSTQGRPLSPDDEVRVVGPDGGALAQGEVGELLTRGPYTLRGYYCAPDHNQEAFTADGFYRTGDLVRELASGHLVVMGRIKDQINRGGEKIAAIEVEGNLVAHPRVVAAALVAAADARLGERSVAFLVSKGTPPTKQEIAAFLRDRGLAAYKFPDQVESLDAMPLTAVGKIDKSALASQVDASR